MSPRRTQPINVDQLTMILYLWTRDTRIEPMDIPMYLRQVLPEKATVEPYHPPETFTDKARESVCREQAAILFACLAEARVKAADLIEGRGD